MNRKTHRLPKATCLACGCQHNRASSFETLARARSDTHDNRPDDGDLTICIRCGHIMAYTADLSMRELTDAEVVKAAGNQEILDIQRARTAVTKTRDKPAQ
jgi:hypothetical protein